MVNARNLICPHHKVDESILVFFVPQRRVQQPELLCLWLEGRVFFRLHAEDLQLLPRFKQPHHAGSAVFGKIPAVILLRPGYQERRQLPCAFS